MTQEYPRANNPKQVTIRLLLFYVLLVAFVVIILRAWPSVALYLPMGGHNALDVEGPQTIQELVSGDTGSAETTSKKPKPDILEIGFVLPFVMAHLLGTIVAMLPITLTYRAINYEHGFRKTFVRSLMLLPLCATTIVLLIQDSLALAFGLAALVAAVRFRVALEEASDGIFIFAAICVGLASGIGYLGVAILMSIFFCFTNTLMWAFDYGKNPIDEARIMKRKEKLITNERSDQS